MTHDLTARWTYPTTIHVGAGKIATLAAHTTALGLSLIHISEPTRPY